MQDFHRHCSTLDLSDAPGLRHNLKVLDMEDETKAVGSRVVVGRHLALSWEEPELLEQTGDDQEHPVLCQYLQNIRGLFSISEHLCVLRHWKFTARFHSCYLSHTHPPPSAKGEESEKEIYLSHWWFSLIILRSKHNHSV